MMNSAEEVACSSSSASEGEGCKMEQPQRRRSRMSAPPRPETPRRASYSAVIDYDASMKQRQQQREQARQTESDVESVGSATEEVEIRERVAHPTAASQSTGSTRSGNKPVSILRNKRVSFANDDKTHPPDASLHSTSSTSSRSSAKNAREDEPAALYRRDNPFKIGGLELDSSLHSLDESLHSYTEDHFAQSLGLGCDSDSDSLSATENVTRNELKKQDSALFFCEDNGSGDGVNDIESNTSRNSLLGGGNGNAFTFRALGRIRQSVAIPRRRGNLSRHERADAAMRNISLTGRDAFSTRMNIIYWENCEDEDMLLRTDGTKSTVGGGVAIKIPSWSKQDRFKRALVIPKRRQVLFGSSIFLGVIFLMTYIIPESIRDPQEGGSNRSAAIISVFIFLQTFVTLITAIPGEDSTNKEINRRINASILIAMTLYPCLGLWMATRPQQLNSSNVWEVLGVDHLWNLRDDASGRYQWGYIFPLLFWSTSACILVRESHFAHTLDREGVVSDDKGKAMTALFRRNPSFVEKFTHRSTRMITFSLWSVLPTQYRPAGGAGRFVFQLFAPFVIVFFYVGYRFFTFAANEMSWIVHNKSDYTRIHAEATLSGDAEHLFDIVQARFIVWLVFSLYCIVIRSVVGTHFFLSHVIHDPQSLKKRWIAWPKVIVESKRRRVLWAFRGLAYSFAPYYVLNTGRTYPSTAIDWIAYYLYFCVYLSFFNEGIGAVFFGLAEAQKGCHLNTPFVLFTEFWFWCAFNGYLQPIGTIFNWFIWATNKEYLMKLHLREILGPLLLNQANNFRFHMPKALRRKAIEVTQKQLDERLEEWVATWRRKRNDVGRDDTSITICRKSKSQMTLGAIPFVGEPVFMGTMFPTRDEWLYMRDNYKDYVPLLPWEQAHYGPEKFITWYPTYREELQSLLSEEYDFETNREVFFFGYGSLISPDCPANGLTEIQKKKVIPYFLKKQAGYRRVWNYRHGSVGMNAFGLEKVHEDEEGAMNIAGCIYPMDYEKASDLFSFREEGYELLLVDADYFEPMHPDFSLPKGVGYVWICGEPIKKCSSDGNTCFDITCKRHSPTCDSPILQSYLDTVIEGALRFSTAGRGRVDGMNFAAAVLTSTVGWDAPWYNDRIFAGRPWTFLPNYEIIDGLLATCPTSREAFVRRRRAAMEIMTSKIPMLEHEQMMFDKWSQKFYPKAPSFTASRMTAPSRFQSVLRKNKSSTSGAGSYADRMYQKSIKGSGAISKKAKERAAFNQSLIAGASKRNILADALDEEPRQSKQISWKDEDTPDLI